jgi:hypothetical protein
MPFKSKAQRGWMFANEPAMAKRWAAHTPKGKKLPEHVKKAEELGPKVQAALAKLAVQVQQQQMIPGAPPVPKLVATPAAPAKAAPQPAAPQKPAPQAPAPVNAAAPPKGTTMALTAQKAQQLAQETPGAINLAEQQIAHRMNKMSANAMLDVRLAKLWGRLHGLV